ncbi:TetR/AcrR family transcriptional regulator [Ectobacillus panaciterrae]|uniref:TetR/AcrR family transcriptional regulator n=1 Tax=Ectobacillus panaciterrae TaxID=363872 RepID=UPI00041C1D8D|nr:TetR/AcrR family transcriptional regulator [Ectobacillus panaciterrae]
MRNTKGEKTRAFIVQKASRLFNTRGYAASSISDVMAETGLKKGGIYNHFETKEDLMRGAFDFAIQEMGNEYINAIARHSSYANKLVAIVDVVQRVAEQELMPGGCPIMNAAIEVDDTDPILREKAQMAMDGLLNLIRSIVRGGVTSGEFNETLDVDYVATVWISTLEGALMLSKLYGQTKPMAYARKHLKDFLSHQICRS